MTDVAHADGGPSAYAVAVMERGGTVLASQIARLEEIVRLALAAMRPDDRARLPLERVSAPSTCSCREEGGRRLDRLSAAVVESQRLVSHESRASAILFLDASRRDEWKSYGDYRRSWDEYVDRCRSRH
jgi:hypothetical protein